MLLTNTKESTTIRPENIISKPDGRSLFDFIGDALAVLWKDYPKNMELARVWGVPGIDADFRLRGICPHCNRETAFESVTKVYIEKSGHGSMLDRWIAACRCIACNDYILGILKFVPDEAVGELLGSYQLAYATHYPLGKPNDEVAEEIPEPIRGEFQEALRCHWKELEAFRAVVLMCRRSLQVSCDMEKAVGNDLFQQIDDLAAKQRITEPLRKMAHRIRLLGKQGAHGDYSDIDATIGQQDADDAIKFMRHYLEHVYVLPRELEEGEP